MKQLKMLLEKLRNKRQGEHFLDNGDSSVYELLDYLQDMIESSAKMPITGKSMIDKKEFIEVIDKIAQCLNKKKKKAEWILNEKDRILGDAQKE